LFDIKWKQADLIADYKAVFKTEAGKRVVYDLMKKGHFMHTSFTGKDNECAFREGERNIVNYILLMMKQDIQKVKEEIERQEQEELDYV